MAALIRFETNERDSLLMAGRMQTIESNLGSMPAKMDVKFTSLTLWGITMFIAEERIDVGMYVWALQQSKFRTSRRSFLGLSKSRSWLRPRSLLIA